MIPVHGMAGAAIAILATRPWSLSALQWLANRGRTPLVVLAYHRVIDLPADLESYSYDAGLISATPEEFRWQMRYLAREFDPITIDMLDDYLRGHGKVTFDDGYLDNYVNAFPILREASVPATFFLSTGYIGTSKVFWFQRAYFIAMTCRPGSIVLPGSPHPLPASGSAQARHKAAKALLKHLKSIPHSEIEPLLDRLYLQCDGAAPGNGLDETAIMNWDHVREMAAQGMSFGSHTVDHCLLTRLNAEERLEQLEASRRKIEAEIGRRITSIAYPVGRRYAYDNDVMEAVALAGYRIALSYESGTNWTRAMNAFELLRQNIEHTVGRMHFRALVQAPSFFV
jgi:peptidoglycan/xylan/chitin deacetylase (PgdA/CDA1 family)